MIKGLKIGFSSASDGNLSYIKGLPAEVSVSRSKYLSMQGIDPTRGVVVSLVHGNLVVEVTNDDAGSLLNQDQQDTITADGLMTSTPGLTLFMVVADCIPVVAYDTRLKILALVHAGRKGIELNILGSAVKQMVQKGSNPNDIIIESGPAIAPESYVFDNTTEIDTDFWAGNLAYGSDKKYHMDTKNKLVEQALELGIAKNNITISAIDTFTNKNYFSHRRSLATGEKEARFAAFAVIKN
ncbi:laccase domain-containing protein [Candidatus Saccharibacteria bacterium]|nr:laccase domain-containing protein [Candidatus Saccharibacteria bacterium]